MQPTARKAFAAALTLTALAACNRAPEPTPAGGEAPSPAAAAGSSAPRVPNPPFQGELAKDAIKHDVSGEYGGNVIFPLIGNPKTFNLIMANETSSTDVLLPCVYSTLIDYDRRTGEDTALMASGWTHSDDFKTWEITLREGLRWSDGQPITSDDVMFSWDVVMDEKIQTSIRSVFDGDARPLKVEKVDGLTVRFVLGAPKYHYYIALGNLYIMPRHKLEEAFKAGKYADGYNTGTPADQIVTSGPYRIKEYVSDQRVVLERNPYFSAVDRDGKRLPYIDTVTFVVTPSTDTSMLKFKNGEVDALEPYVYPKDYKAMVDGAEAGKYKVERIGLSYNTNFWWLNQNTRAPIDQNKVKWFRDRRFRKAMAHATDREGIVRTVLFGLGQPLWEFPSPANKRWSNTNVVHHDYDLDKARAMLEEIGFKDRNGDGLREDPDGKPFTFTMVTNSNNTDRVRTLSLLVEDFNKAGLHVKAEPMDFNALVSKFRTTYDYEAALLGLSTAVPPTPLLSMNVLRSSGITHYWSPQQEKPGYPWEATIDEMMNKLESTPEYPEMKAIYDQVQSIIAEEQPWTTTVAQEFIAAYKNRIKNAHPSPLRPTTYWNVEELWLDPLE